MVVEIIVLEKPDQIGTIRRIKQFNNSANLNLINGNEKMFEFWTMKADYKIKEFRQKMGWDESVEFITMQGTSKEIAVFR